MYHGLINVYKEQDYTSFDVVAVLRGILKQKKIGHTGTLDPKAEGVLLVCLGNGTKLVNMLEDSNKTYKATMLLGVETDTEDTTGTITGKADYTEDIEAIENAIMSFVGEYNQVPPMYSALKHNGKKLYELARNGIEIERSPRKLFIHSIKIESIKPPYATFEVSCSKGTYIRSLCRDIGIKLGTKACMDKLIRTEVSGFNIEKAYKLSEIEALCKDGKIEDVILPLEKVFTKLRRLEVKESHAKYINNGNPLIEEDVTSLWEPQDNEEFRVYDSNGRFAAVYRYDSDKNMLMPVRMFPEG